MSIDEIREKLEAGADPNARMPGKPSLLHQTESAEIAKLLLQHGAHLRSLCRLDRESGSAR